MKLLTIFLLFTMTSFAATTSDLVVAKMKNYQWMHLKYQNLNKLLSAKKAKEFCLDVDNSISLLYKVLDADLALAYALKQYRNEDFDNYSKHLYENAYSDLFAFDMFQAQCDEGRTSQSLKAFKRIFINLNYLINAHTLWMRAYCPYLKGKCTTKKAIFAQ